MLKVATSEVRKRHPDWIERPLSAAPLTVSRLRVREPRPIPANSDRVLSTAASLRGIAAKLSKSCGKAYLVPKAMPLSSSSLSASFDMCTDGIINNFAEAVNKSPTAKKPIAAPELIIPELERMQSRTIDSSKSDATTVLPLPGSKETPGSQQRRTVRFLLPMDGAEDFPEPESAASTPHVKIGIMAIHRPLDEVTTPSDASAATPVAFPTTPSHEPCGSIEQIDSWLCSPRCTQPVPPLRRYRDTRHAVIEARRVFSCAGLGDFQTYHDGVIAQGSQPESPIDQGGVENLMAETTVAVKRRKLMQVEQMLDLVGHSSTCSEEACSHPKCGNMKTVLAHMKVCPWPNGCKHCRQMTKILKYHACKCDRGADCPIFLCRELKVASEGIAQQPRQSKPYSPLARHRRTGNLRKSSLRPET